MLKLKTKKIAPLKTVDVDTDVTVVRAPTAYAPKRIDKRLVVVLMLLGVAPGAGISWAVFSGHNVEETIRLIGPYLLLAWPLLLWATAKIWVKTLTTERDRTAAEWRQPMIALRSRVAALQVVSRARYKRPEDWPDEWPRDNIS